ncbi:UbiA-like protein EboC [Negadavirga shengliensis]|uniref:UbiA-like protein EboC n=1 Tax=Negadavirga shengliensis TaxID=1389218 RepID=A0ABV9T5Z7_9BACT
MGKLKAHVRLTRPANIVTAIADILAGFSVSGAVWLLYPMEDTYWFFSLLWLMLSTIGLYGGGVAFNDVFDAELDAKERPERPIPSGQATVTSAGWMAFGLMLMGVLAAWMVNAFSGWIAISIALLAVLYDAWGKHQLIFGPINMGLCRAGNLLLGVSVIPEMIGKYWYLGLIPLFYVAAITMVSRGEVHGKNKSALQGGMFIYLLIVTAIFILSFIHYENWWESLPFLILLVYFIFPPLWRALKFQEPSLIGKAVKAAVLALIILNATLASAFSGWVVGLCILLLLPLSLKLAKVFAVT